jgi:hypothetical protein
VTEPCQPTRWDMGTVTGSSGVTPT